MPDTILNSDDLEVEPVGPCISEGQAAQLPYLMLGDGDSNREDGETATEDQYFKNAGEWIEQYYEASYGVLPEDHPLTQYVAGLNARFPKLSVKFKILPGWKQVNAAALPNNTILLSAGLIEFCEYEEELMFVLGHERTHLKHHFQHHGKSPSSGRDLLQEIGHHRLAEYEADLRGVVEEMDLSGINPYGGKYFLERLSELEVEQGEQKDFVHGGSLDRMLNISTTARLFDLRELAMDLTPWANAKELPKTALDLHHGINSPLPQNDKMQWHIHKNLDDLGRSGKNALLFGNHIYQRLQNATEYAEYFPKSLYAQLDLQFTQDMLSVMQKNTDDMICDLFPSFSAKGIEMFKVFLYHFVAGIPVLTDMELSSAFWDSIETEEDFEKLAQVCSLENLQRTGFFMVANPEEWLRALLVHACELGLFGDGSEFDQKKYADFADKLCRQFESLNKARGTMIFDTEKMGRVINEVAEPSMEKDAATVPVESIGSGLDACILDIIYNCPKFSKPRAEEYSVESINANIQIENSYIESKMPTLLALNRFSTGKELVQYIVSFLKRIEKKLDPREESIFIQLMRNVWLSIEPDIEENFLLKAFLDTLTPSVGIAFEVSKDFLRTEENLEHSARSLFDATYRKEVWGIEEEEENKEKAKETNERRSAFIQHCLIEYFISLPTKEALLVAMKKYELYGFDFSRGGDFTFAISANGQWFLAKIFTKHTFSPENLDATDIELLLLLSKLMVDVSRAMRLQSVLLKKILEKKSFDEQIEILFNNKLTNAYGDIELRDSWVETKTHTPDELHSLEDAAMKSLESWSHSKTVTKSLGEWAFLDVIDAGFWENKAMILFYLIQTQESDENIKKYFVEKYHLNSYGKYESGEAAEKLVRIDVFLNGIFGFSDEMRYALLRILLMGKDGIFRSRQSRQFFLDKFLKTALTESGEEDDLLQLLFDIAPVLAEIDDPELFYFAFLPLLFRKFARYPEQKVSWLDILENVGSRSPKTVMTEYYKIIKYGGDDLIDLTSAETFNFVNEKTINDFIDEKFLKPAESTQEEAPMTPLALIIEIAKSLGATGVRFLQLLGQYIEIPEHYGASFSGVYDQMRGQSKLAAYRLIKREWPDFAQKIKKMHPRIGGGSLMTVYEVETQDDKREVLKVLNPNVEFHLDRTFVFLQELVDSLVKRFGDKYEAVRFALDDIREWITHDVTLDKFLADDLSFAIKNHGFRIEEGDDAYHIGVPKTYEPENHYFIREEFIPGKNLTQWDELVAEGHDMRKIVPLLAKNYMAQIADGQAHADIHVGNIRVTDDRTCYILDRAGYLRFDDDDKRLFLAFLQAPSETMHEIAIAYFRKYNDAPYLERKVATAIDEMTSPQDLLLRLKRAKVKVPLKITLLMKNLSVLDIFAKKAGFAGLQEALAA